jgi:hypothetical protein
MRRCIIFSDCLSFTYPMYRTARGKFSPSISTRMDKSDPSWVQDGTLSPSASVVYVSLFAREMRVIFYIYFC